MKKLIIVFALIAGSICGYSQNVIRGEYFIDTDPGFGNAIAFTVALPDSDITQSISVPYNSFPSPGYHYMYIRTIDDNGNWSITKRKLVDADENTGVLKIVNMEYFIDTDPGFGNGIPVTVTLPDSDITQAINIPYNSFPSSGYHYVYLRAIDDNGTWSITKRKLVEADENIGTLKVVNIEYFFDVDNGFGNNYSTRLTASTDSTWTFDIPFNHLPATWTANDTLFLRVQDSIKGNWSITKLIDSLNFTSAKPQGSLSANGPFCGEGTGQLTFTATAGAGPYTLVYNNGSGNDTVTGVVSGTPFYAANNPVTITTTYTLVSVGDNNGDSTRYSGFTGDTAIITVNPVLTAAITGTATGCGSVTLTASGGTGYSWSGGSSTGTATDTFTSSNTYTVTVNGTDGCSAIASQSVTVNAAPVAAITPQGGTTTFCMGDSVILTAGTAGNYLWSTAAITQSITVKQSGTYTVTVTNVNNCTAVSAPVNVTVNSLPPTPTIAATGDTLTSTPAASYQWYLNDVLLSGATNQQLIINSVGTYTVQITGSNGCDNISAGLTFNPFGITGIAADYTVQLYPNPNNGNFTLHFSDNVPHWVSITDVTGKLIVEGQQVTTYKDFDCSVLPAGVYLLSIKDGSGVRTLRVVVAK